MTPALLRATLIARREAFGWTQAILAHRMGSKPSTVSRLERGYRSPSLGMLLLWLEALQLDLQLAVRARR